jgi:2,3,4,5-tetrahydropyridine-2,6-dicarboxylate N-succinyltransferase
MGLATMTAGGQVLDTWYPSGKLGLGDPPTAGTPVGVPMPVAESVAMWSDVAAGATALATAGAPVGLTVKGYVGEQPLPGLEAVAVFVVIGSLADPPKDSFDAYLRLHLLSHRLIGPHQANLDQIFALLANVAWTSVGPCPPDRVDELRWAARAMGHRLAVYGVDKFPRMVDYVVPGGVRIADADRVRLGAHLASGTAVMHEGFVNFNAGTLGASMVEGRISAGVVVGDGTDIGGGASIMGTLSGGGQDVIRLGERCLLGANAGIGISLGNDCVVEAGCYITAGSKVRLPSGEVVKARALSGMDGLLFWRNSLTGAMEARPRTGDAVVLNAALHAND